MQFMRAGPLSNDKVIDMLNLYFVPVSVSNDAYTREKDIPKEEREEKVRIVRESWKLSGPVKTGEDALYVLNSDGRVVDSIRAPDSMQEERLIPFLEKNITALHATKGDAPLAAPTRQWKQPKAGPDDLVLHLTARYLPKGDGWAKIPAEDWIVFQPGEWKKLLPGADAKVNDRWPVDRKVAEKLLTNFYPPTGNTDLRTNVMEKLRLDATVVSMENGKARVRLDGELRMRHPFFTTGFTPSGHFQAADESYTVVLDKIVGFVDCDLRQPSVRSVRVLAENGKYAKKDFAVAVRSHTPSDSQALGKKQE
jgi:hypothetical protein